MQVEVSGQGLSIGVRGLAWILKSFGIGVREVHQELWFGLSHQEQHGVYAWQCFGDS